MRERERIVVMNDPGAMRINKELAEEIGFQESIIFLQLEYLISTPDTVIDGRKWRRLPLRILREKHFPWWSEATILRVLNRLRERNLILTDDTLNELGYDRTQWYAIDEEGVRELDSVAIFQNEKRTFQNAGLDVSDCKTETDKMKNADLQNETTIHEEGSKEPKETFPNGNAKKAAPLSLTGGSRKEHLGQARPKQVGELSPEEAERLWEELCASDRFGDELRKLAKCAAGENKTGKKRFSALWNEIGERYVKRRSNGDLSDEAWEYGFEETISRSKGSIGYVISCATGYRPTGDAGRSRGRRHAGATDQSGREVGDGADRPDSSRYTAGYEFLFERG